MALELLWTPDSQEDFLSEAKMLCDYPNLVDLATGKLAEDLCDVNAQQQLQGDAMQNNAPGQPV